MGITQAEGQKIIEAEILVVEDSLTQALKLTHLLKRTGYSVRQAKDGKQALDMMKQKLPTIVISDVVMPEMDGYELCNSIKSDESMRHVPVILLTTLSDPQDVIMGLKAGADNFLTKPYNDQSLLSRIQHILVNRDLRRHGSGEMGMEVFFAGKQHHLNSERIQIIDLLLSTFENAVEHYRALQESNKQLKEALDEIEVLQQNYWQMLESNSDAMVAVGKDGLVLYANPSAERLLDRSLSDIKQNSLGIPMNVGDVSEVEIPRKDNLRTVAEMRVVETIWDGSPVHLATLRDITERKRMEEEITALSLKDELTGLNNRRGFQMLSLQQIRLAERLKSPVFVLAIDMDGLKWINDTLGHKEGDRAISDLANILKVVFRESDIIARLGGDEFAVLFLASNHEGGDAVMERLKESVSSFNAKMERPFRLSMSGGLVKYAPGVDEPQKLDALLSEADKLMYEEKRSKGASRMGSKLT